MKEHQFNRIKDECAQKIQAVYKGYSIRKHFLTVRLRQERIVKTIEGDSQVSWKSNHLCWPIVCDTAVLNRINEIDLRVQALTKELNSVENKIQQRKLFLKSK